MRLSPGPNLVVGEVPADGGPRAALREEHQEQHPEIDTGWSNRSSEHLAWMFMKEFTTTFPNLLFNKTYCETSLTIVIHTVAEKLRRRLREEDARRADDRGPDGGGVPAQVPRHHHAPLEGRSRSRPQRKSTLGGAEVRTFP